jgi:hypothetical protein
VRYLGLPLVLACLSTPAHAGAWTRTFGSHYVRVGYDAYVALSWESPVAGSNSATGYQSHGLSLYGEVGLTPRHPLHLQLTVPFTYGVLQFTTVDAAEGSVGVARSFRPSDLQAGLQTRLYKGPIELSALLEMKVPMYRANQIGAQEGTWQEVFPLPGDGQIDITPWLLLGFGTARGFGELHIGYRVRTEAFIDFDTAATFVDGIPIRAKGGVLAGPVWLMADLDAVVNYDDDPYTREFVRLGSSMLWTVWKGLGIEARFAGEPFADNTARGIGFGIGLSWRGDGPQP